MRVVNSLLLPIFFILSSNAQSVIDDVIAPKIEITDWINNPHGQSVIKGKPVVLEFWSTWCAPCIAAIPHLNNLTEKFGEDIAFISVNSYESRERVEKFLLKKHIKSYVALDENENLKNSFNIQNIPVTVIIDKDGMLRWRGIASELTEEILQTFISENVFYQAEKNVEIFDKNLSFTVPRIIDYHLKISPGDRTMGKGITTDFKNGFYLKLSNYSIYAVFTTFSDLFDSGENWAFDGNYPENEIINIEIKSDINVNSENVADAKAILNHTVLELGKYYNYNVSLGEEMQEIWYIVPSSTQLEQFLSADQNSDLEKVENTEEYIKYKNVFFDYLASFISIRTKEKIEYDPIEPIGKYDLTIPKTDDIYVVKTYLKEKYGIELIKKEVKVNVSTVIFN